MAVRRSRSLWKGLVAGAAGGAAGSWAMNAFQALVWDGGRGSRRGRSGRPFDRLQASDPHETEDGDATVEAADRLSRRAAGRPLTRREQEIAGPAVHYAFGAVAGAFYGALSEVSPRTASGFGMPFGTSVWLGGVEAALPALGLSKPPAAYPPSMHAFAFASHLVYGLTADLVRRGVRRALG